MKLFIIYSRLMNLIDAEDFGIIKSDEEIGFWPDTFLLLLDGMSTERKKCSVKILF